MFDLHPNPLLNKFFKLVLGLQDYAVGLGDEINAALEGEMNEDRLVTIEKMGFFMGIELFIEAVLMQINDYHGLHEKVIQTLEETEDSLLKSYNHDTIDHAPFLYQGVLKQIVETFDMDLDAAHEIFLHNASKAINLSDKESAILDYGARKNFMHWIETIDPDTDLEIITQTADRDFGIEFSQYAPKPKFS